MKPWLNRVNQWMNKRGLNALRKAYEGAVMIKGIEDQHFAGQKISPSSQRGKSVYDYFQSNLQRELWKIRFNLAQFRLANLTYSLDQFWENASETTETEVLETLDFIESVIGKYREDFVDDVPPSINPSISRLSESLNNPPLSSSESNPNPLPNLSRSGVFFDIPPKVSLEEYEQQVVQQLRTLRQEKKIAIRFLMVLVLVPLVVQIVSKNLVYSPLINWAFVDNVRTEKIQLSKETAEQFFTEFSHLKESLEIQYLLGIRPELNEEKKREILKERALELGKEAAYETLTGWKNLLADLTSLVAFTGIIYIFRRQFVIAREVISRYFLSLSDVTKVFIFILLTDIFVGFHSAEGWEVVLGNLFKHFSIPENHTFINLFIATIPVILDSLFKLLIFNYLTRKSPSAVAILEKMQQ